MQRYVCHFTVPAPHRGLTCTELSHSIAERCSAWRASGQTEQADQPRAPREAGEGPGALPRDRRTPPGARTSAALPSRERDARARGASEPRDPGAALSDAASWAAVGRVQWGLASAGPLTEDDARGRLADLHSRGLLEDTCAAFHRLSAAACAVYPALAGLGRPRLLQLVALGHDMVRAAGETPELLAYAEKELQPLDLAALLACVPGR